MNWKRRFVGSWGRLAMKSKSSKKGRQNRQIQQLNEELGDIKEELAISPE